MFRGSFCVFLILLLLYLISRTNLPFAVIVSLFLIIFPLCVFIPYCAFIRYFIVCRTCRCGYKSVFFCEYDMKTFKMQLIKMNCTYFCNTFFLIFLKVLIFCVCSCGCKSLFFCKYDMKT